MFSKLIAATTIILAALNVSSAADAAEDPATLRKPVHIEAQELGSALQTLANGRDVQVLYRTEVVEKLRTSGAAGELTLEEALKQLLAGTGLTYRWLDERTVTIVQAVAGAESMSGPQANDENISLRLVQLSSAATAQASSSSEPSEEQQQKKADELVVTGSRFARTQYESPAPIAVTTQEEIARAGTNKLYDVLTRSPQFTIGTGANNIVDLADAGSGANFVNLRNLGTNRTLVLVDGRRRVSGSNTSAAVDLAMIPSNMVKRMEVVTGGAAAIYGADAVSGAINILLKDDVDGLELSAKQSLSGYGDGHSSSYDLFFGGAVGARGRIVLGASFTDDDRVKFSDRRSLTDGFTANFFPNPLNTGPRDGRPDTLFYRNLRIPYYPYSGGFTVGGTLYTYDQGALRPVNLGTPVFSIYSINTNDGANGAESYALRSGQSAFSSLTHFTYDLTEQVTFKADVQFAQTRGNAPLGPFFSTYVIQRNNPSLPAAVAALMDANALTSITVNRADKDFGFVERDTRRAMLTGVAGFEGKLGSSLTWDVFAQYGRFDVKDTERRNRVVSRLNAAVAGCPSGSAAGCVPLNIFGEGVANPASMAFFRYDPLKTTFNTQKITGAQISGDVFELPMGQVGFAAGLEYRQETSETIPDGLAVQGLLTRNITTPLKGEFDVKEAFMEVTVPLLKDVSFAHELTLDGAVRRSRYSTAGYTTTWKEGLVYAPIPDVRFRVTGSRSVRAPNMGELFNPGSSTLAFLVDPCNAQAINASPQRAQNCAALGVPPSGTTAFQATVNTRGNPALNPETSDSITGGVVLQPSFLPGFSASVDYFDVDISGAITTLVLADILNGCVDGTSLEPTLCNLITRGAGGSVLTANVTPINIGKLQVRGVDIGADYTLSAGSIKDHPLRLNFALDGSYYLQDDVVVNRLKPELTTYQDGTIVNPRFRGNLATTATAGKASVTWLARYISPSKVVRDPNQPELREINNISARVYHDLYANVDFTQSLQVSLGVNNLLNTEPPNGLTFDGGGTLFDKMGQYFFVSAKMTF